MCETDRDPWLLCMDLTDVPAVDLIFLGGLDPTFLMQLAPQVWFWTQNDDCSLGRITTRAVPSKERGTAWIGGLLGVLIEANPCALDPSVKSMRIVYTCWSRDTRADS